MNQEEQTKPSVLNSVLEYQVPITQAAEVLGVDDATNAVVNSG